MIINQVGSGNKSEASDSDVIPLDSVLVVLFKKYSNRGTDYKEAFSGKNLTETGKGFLIDDHIYQPHLQTDKTIQNTCVGPSETVSLSTHVVSSIFSTFNKTSVGEKKGSGLMFIYFVSIKNLDTARGPDSDACGIFTEFTFDFTDGKDIITPEITSVGDEDIRTKYPEYPLSLNRYSGVFGYIMRVTFE